MKIARTLSPRFVFLLSLLLSLMLGVVDWASGYELQFFIFYFIPISMAGWNCGLARTLAVSALCGGLWFSIDVCSGHPYSNWFYSCWSALIRIASFLVNGYSVVRIKDLLLAGRKAAADLQQAQAEVQALKGLLPICATCHACAEKTLRDAGIQVPSAVPDSRSGAAHADGEPNGSA